jgi:hypothetical protein
MKKDNKEKEFPKNPSSRRWCFTLYPEQIPPEFLTTTENPSIQEEATPKYTANNIDTDFLESFLMSSIPTIRGLIYSLESGDSKEHLHIQGYFELEKPQRFARLQSAIGMGVHLEIAKGDRSENFAYIRHQGKHRDKGTLEYSNFIGLWPDIAKDTKNCYDEAVAMIFEGVSVAEVLRYYKGVLLKDVGNLCRLKTAIDDEVSDKINNRQLSKDISRFVDRGVARYRKEEEDRNQKPF